MISVVIPTLNAANGLAATLARIAPSSHRLVQEVIVSDGGSRDATIDLATSAECRVVTGPAGRGLQLRRGAAQARGEWLLCLHADTRLAEGWAAAVQAFIDRTSGQKRAAAFRFELDDPSVSARLLERIVAVRVRMFGLPYGDQGLLLSRAFYDEIGGYRELPLMEDVDIVRRIGRSRIETLATAAVTSADRYRRNGYAHRVLRNGCCLGLYMAGVPPRMIVRLYG